MSRPRDGGARAGGTDRRETLLLFTKILLTVSVCEALIMVVLYMMDLQTAWDIPIDLVVLAVLSGPPLYWLLARLTRTNSQLGQEISRRMGLERELIRVVEQERQQIGRELHDSLGQQLMGIAFMVQVLAEMLADKSLTEEALCAEKIDAQVSRAADLAGNLAKGLHPVNLDRNGLVAALQDLAADTEDLFDVSCIFTPGESVSLGHLSAPINVYRIVQEAITNAVKHGKARNIRVGLSGENGDIVLTVENDGLPFPAEAGRAEGMGLKIMRYRAELMNGSLTIHEGARGGTVMTCVLPKEGNS